MTMRAAVVTAPGEIEIQEVALPEPGAGQIRVRLEGCGVCASNVPPWEGREWFEYPMAPGALGHEGWGTVETEGGGFAEGDRVAFLSGNSYAEYDVTDASAAVRLPSALAGKPFPGEPLGCAMNVLKRAGVERPEGFGSPTVAIVGIGFLGAVLVRLATQQGARVIALDRKPAALQTAANMGAAETILMDDHWRVIEAVKELTDGRLCETVIEVTGKQWPLDLAGEITGEYGHLAIAGYHQDGLRTVNLQMWNWKALEVTNAHERDPKIYHRGMEEAVEAVASGRLDPSPLYTHTLPLDRLGEALDMARDRPEGFMKALVTMESGR